MSGGAPVVWIREEVERSMARAREALATLDVGRAPLGLRAAHGHLHQVTGALRIVGMDGAARFSEEIEHFLRDVDERGPTAAESAPGLARRSMDALMQFVVATALGRQLPPLLLLPLFSEMQHARGVTDVAPAELYFPALDVDPPSNPDARPVAAGALPVLVAAERARFQRGLLAWIRRDPNGLAAMRDALVAIDNACQEPAERTLWWCAAAMLEGLMADALEDSAALKKLCARIDQQLKHFAEGRSYVAERLLREVLYQIARADPAHPAIARVQDHFDLASSLPRQDMPTFASLEREEREQLTFEARESLRRAKSAWLAYGAGQSDAAATFARHVEALRNVAGELLNLPVLRLAEFIGTVFDSAGARAGLGEELMAEMASALLVAESALEQADGPPPELDLQVDVLLERLRGAARGQLDERIPPPVEMLDRRDPRTGRETPVADVVREVRGNLQHIEQVLDGFFRDPGQRPQLAELAPLLEQVRGAFGLLELDRASALARQCERVIRRMTSDERGPDEQDVELVAEGLTSLDLFVQDLELQAPGEERLLSDALASFAPDEARAEARERDARAPAPSLEGEIRVARERLARLSRAWERHGAERGLLEEISQQLEALARDAEIVGDGALGAEVEQAIEMLAADASMQTLRAVRAIAEAHGHAGAPEPSAEAARLVDAGAEVVERELLRVYLGEASEVLREIAAALDQCSDGAECRDALLTTRLCFHTLKGSGRMVGLNDLAQAAWCVEQALNYWLQEELPASSALLEFLHDARIDFSSWVERLGDNVSVAVDVASFAARSAALMREAPGLWLTAQDEAHGLVDVAPPPGAPPERVLQGAARSGIHALPGELLRLYLEEAAGHLRALRAGCVGAPSSEETSRALRAAHTLAGISRTTGFPGVAVVASALERWLSGIGAPGAPAAIDDAPARAAVDAIDAMIADVARSEAPRAAGEVVAALEAASAELASGARASERGGAIDDDVDHALFPLFLEEAEDLSAVMGEDLRQWRSAPEDAQIPQALRRSLHTLKGSARLVGAMRFGDEVHRTETRLLEAIGRGEPAADLIDELEERLDGLGAMLQAIASEPGEGAAPGAPAARRPAALGRGALVPSMRLSADVLDGLVSRAGEISLTRTHLESEVLGVRQLMVELTETVSRLRSQLREMELGAELAVPAQLASSDPARDTGEAFDPLEIDRYTRLQELVRLMQESTLDVLTIQSGLRKAVDDASAVLRSQSRAGRELQDTLMRVRTVAFTTVVDRLHRVLRQACRELGKQARLGVEGQHVELDRGVLEKLLPALEHLLRNCIAHGIERPETRAGEGKSEYGDVRVVVRQEASEIIIEVVDDGAGLDYQAIRGRAVADALVAEDERVDQATLDRLIFSAGFSTSAEVTGLAGRGVGLDAVRSDVQALGGWVEVLSEAGRGSAFRLHLPLTLVVAQTLLVRCAERSYALPTQAVEHVHRLDADALEETRSQGFLSWAGRRYAYHYLPQLLGEGTEPPRGRHNPVVLARAGDECLALQVDTTVRSHEAVLRNLGPQIASIPGIIGATVLSSGEITPIVNPFYLARQTTRVRLRSPPAPPPAAPGDGGPLVMVVDDSLTVRRVLENLLTRQGYDVLTARDGVEAGNLLREYRPDVLLVDIEMPRMDGFELTRQVRANSATADIPVIMITSRSADKHREHARKLGADVFIGKPFVEDELLAYVSSFASRARASSFAPPGA